MRALIAAVLLATLSALAFGEPPTRPFPSFTEKFKRMIRDGIYSDHAITFYCGCAYAPNPKGSSGKIDATECGYTPRKSKTRGSVMEWEHVVPTKFFGGHRKCWKEGHDKCVNEKGVAFKGRECCSKVDVEFKRIEADLHNLTPAVGEINGDRSDHPYGIVEGPRTDYGACDFKIGGKPKVAEPRNSVKGDAARIWFYMSETYGVKLTAAQRKMFEEWSAADIIDNWERLRDTRIEGAQGNRNPFVK